MVFLINQYRYPLLIMYALLAIILSAVVKQDAFMLLNMAIAGVAATYILLKKSYLLLITVIVVFIFNEGVSQFNLTYVIFYLYALMIASIFISKEKNKVHSAILIGVALSLVLGVIPAIINGSSLPLLITSVLKRYGFFIVFLFALNMPELNQKYRKLMNMTIIILLLVNFSIAFLQFLKGEVHQDFITGMMGGGTTGIFIYLFMFYLAIVSGLHYEQKISTFIYLSLAMVPIVYSAIAEVKIGFVSTALILLVYLVFIKRGIKALIVLIATSFMLSLFYSYFVSLYPTHDFLDEAFLEEYLVDQSYGGGDTLNRFGFKSTVDTIVFLNNPNEMLFGKGVGSGNPSDTPVLQGEVYKKYDFLKYSWFILPYLYIETGFLGMIIFSLIYLIPLFIALKHFLRKKSSLAIVVLLMGVTNIMFVPYNTGLLSYGVIAVFWIYTAMMLQEIQQTDTKENKKIGNLN